MGLNRESFVVRNRRIGSNNSLCVRNFVYLHYFDFTKSTKIRFGYHQKLEKLGEDMREFESESSKTAKLIGLAGVAIVGSLVVIPILGTWYTVDEGERAVLLRNGAITGVSQPGFHGKLPIIDDPQKISIREKETSLRSDSYSRDQQPAEITAIVTWRIREGEVADVYSQFGGEEGVESRLIATRVPQAIRVVFSQFTAEKSIAERGRMNSEIMRSVREAVGDKFVEVLSVQTSVDFSDAYEESIEKRMLAEVRVTEEKQNAEREKIQAEIEVTRAQAKADSDRALAIARAEGVKAMGEAEATAIRAKGEALRDNPMLVGLISAERWDGKLPNTMVPGGAIPFVSVDN